MPACEILCKLSPGRILCGVERILWSSRIFHCQIQRQKDDRSRICVRHLDSSCLSSGDLNIRLYASIPKTCWYVIMSSLIRRRRIKRLVASLGPSTYPRNSPLAETNTFQAKEMIYDCHTCSHVHSEHYQSRCGCPNDRPRHDPMYNMDDAFHNLWCSICKIMCITCPKAQTRRAS